MKSDHVRRSVRTTRFSREAGDAPNLGRVSRMPRVERAKGVRRKRKSSDREARGRRKINNKAVVGWSLLLGSLVIVILGVALGLWLVPKMRSGGGQAMGKDSTRPIEKRRVISDVQPPSEVAAVALVRAAMAVRDPGQVLEFFRPGGAPAEEIIQFLAKIELERGKAESFDWLSSVDANGLALEGVVVRSREPSGSKQELLALLTPDSAGKWKVDFDALSRKSTPSWQEFMEGRSEVIEVRVFAAVDNYYNGFFQDDSQWECYGMTLAGSEENYFGYCRRDSPQAKALGWMFSREKRLQRVTLELKRQPEAGPRQFEITRVVAEDWVVSDVPFDAAFAW